MARGEIAGKAGRVGLRRRSPPIDFVIGWNKRLWHGDSHMTIPRNRICLMFNKDAEAAANFYAEIFPGSSVESTQFAPSDNPSGEAGEVLVVEFTVLGIPCIGVNGGPSFKHSEAFSFQVTTDTQEEIDAYWDAIVSNGGEESMCGWCKDKWGVFWQITPRTLTEAMTTGGPEAKRAFDAMMQMKKIDIATINAARKGDVELT